MSSLDQLKNDMYEQDYKQNSLGFTLLELLLVVAMSFTIGLLSIPFYARFYTQNRVESTTNHLISSLRKAQFYSMMGRQNGNWGVRYGSSQIIFYQGNSYATRNADLDEIYEVAQNTSISGFTEINFAKVTGVPSTTATIGISGNNTTRTITINSQGVVSQ